MKNKIIIALTLIIVVFLISFFYYKNEIEKKDRIELSMNITDSTLYGFNDLQFLKSLKGIYLDIHNFVDTNIFKNHTFKYTFNEIQKKYPLIDSLWIYVYGTTQKEQNTRYGFGPTFYVDSNYIYGMLVYFPMDSTDKYGYDFKLLSGSSIYKIYQVRSQRMDTIKAGLEKMKELYKSEYEDIEQYRKFDSLKAVLNR